MLIWVGGAPPGLGAESGIVRAGEIASVLAIGQLSRHAEDRRDEILAVAQAGAGEALDAARREADGVLAAAHRQAADLLEDTARRSEEAVERGYTEGQRQAVAEWHERHADQQLANTQSLQALDAKLAEIVIIAVRRIIQTEQRESLFQRALHNVQGLTRGSGKVTLRVSSADVEQARSALSGLPDDKQNGAFVEVTADPLLTPGSCVFESDIGTLDASLDTQLEGLRSALVRAVQKALAEEEGADADADGAHDEAGIDTGDAATPSAGAADAGASADGGP